MMLRRTLPVSSLVVTGKTFMIPLPLTASSSLGKSNWLFLTPEYLANPCHVVDALVLLVLVVS